MAYTPLTGKVMGRTVHAIRLRTQDGAIAWVPRSCIEDAGESADEALLSGLFMPDVTLSVADWKMDQEGWT